MGELSQSAGHSKPNKKLFLLCIETVLPTIFKNFLKSVCNDLAEFFLECGYQKISWIFTISVGNTEEQTLFALVKSVNKTVTVGGNGWVAPNMILKALYFPQECVDQTIFYSPPPKASTFFNLQCCQA